MPNSHKLNENLKNKKKPDLCRGSTKIMKQRDIINQVYMKAFIYTNQHLINNVRYNMQLCKSTNALMSASAFT